MFHNKIHRAKTFTLLHLFYCVVTVLSFVIYHAIYGFGESSIENWRTSDGVTMVYIWFMFIIYVSFCISWCINARIALLSISKKKQKLLKYHGNIGITIMVFSAPVFVWIAYLYIVSIVYRIHSGWDPMNAFTCRTFSRYLFSFSMLMFFGTLLSSFVLYLWYQIKKDFSTLVTSTPHDQEDIVSTVCNIVICHKKPNQNTP